MKRYKIIFLGTPEFSLPSLQALIDNQRFDVLAVVTEPDKPAGRGGTITPPPVKVLAKKHQFHVLQPVHISHIANRLSQLRPDVAIVVAYGQIIPKEILNIPKHGFVNIHPSLLPKYRGPTPIQAAILNGEKQTGVTLMKMDEKMDHGPILAQQELEFSIFNFQFSILSNKLAELGADLLIKTLPDYLAGEIKPQPQNHQQATYTKLLKKSDGKINWQEPVELIERKIRAYFPWPGAYTRINNQQLKILQAHIKNSKIIFDKVQLEGKKTVSWPEFNNGYKKPLDFSDKVVI